MDEKKWINAQNGGHTRKFEGHIQSESTNHPFRFIIDDSINLIPQKKYERILDIGCFPPKTEINTENHSFKYIEEIREGDLVLTNKNNIKKVIKTFKREIKEELFSIECPYSIKLTGTKEHPILAINKSDVICKRTKGSCNTNQKGRCSICGKKKYNSPKYIPLNKLKLGDYVAIPRCKTKEIIEVDSDFARLLGYFLAEGSIIYSHKPHIGGICLTFHYDEDEYISDIVNIIEKIKGHTSHKITKRLNKMICEIRIYGKEFAENIVRLCGHGAFKIFLNKEIYSWDDKSKIELLKGLFSGDGHLRTKLGTTQYTWKTVSKQLHKDVIKLFFQLGICPSVYYETSIRNKFYNYALTLCGVDINILCENFCTYPSKKRYKTTEDFIFIPIDNIKKEEYHGVVYNLEVEHDNSYIANNVAVHNCGDGYSANVMKEKFDCEAHGITITPIEVEWAKNKYPQVKAQVMDAHDLTYPDEYFDVIFMRDSFEHMLSPFLVLNECYRCLKPHGLIVIALPINDPWDVWHEHLIVPNKRQMTHLLDIAGFDVMDYSEKVYPKECALTQAKYLIKKRLA